MRDVLGVQREHVELALVEGHPTFVPMGREERVVADGYNQQQPSVVAEQVEQAAALLSERAASPDEAAGYRGLEVCMVRSDPIVIRPHDPAWAQRFSVERQRLEPLLRPWTVRPIEHIGSTAVLGLDAKPIIDMLAVVENIDAFDLAADALVGLGWRAAPEPSDVDLRRRSWCRPDVAERTHHLHVVEERSEQWRSWIAFRDMLRTHPSAAAEYATLKRRLAEQFGSDPNDREAYRRGKTAFTRHMLQSFQDHGGAT